MAYSRLMRSYYRREAPIPDAEKYRLTRAVTKAQRTAVDTVLAEFFYREGDLWRQKRCDEEVAAYQAQASTNRRIARTRSVNEPSTNRERIVERTVDESLTKRPPNQNQIPEPEAINQNQKKLKNGAAAPPSDPAKEEIWLTGRAILEGQGASRNEAGGLLGKLVKDYGQKLVLEAVRDCAKVTPAEAKGWLVARCQERRTQTGNKQSALEARNAAAAAEWLAREAN